MRLQVKKIPYCAGNRGCGIGFKAQRKGGLNLARQVLAGGVSLLSLAGGTFTRATSAWDPIAQAIAPPGVMRTLTQSLVPTLQDILALIEGARTNLIAAGLSEHFELANGGLVNLTVASGSIAPDGSATACHLQEKDTVSESHLCAFNIAWTNATVYCVTVYLKQAERTWGAIGLSSSIYTGGATCFFNLATGVPGQVSPGCTTSMTAAANGYWRCQLIFTTTATATAGIFIYTANANGSSSYAGTVGSGVLAWGMQAEAAAFPSSYISNRNLLTHTNALSNAAWNLLGGTLAQTGAALPTGETGWTFTCSASSQTLYQAISGLTAGATYTASWWAKAGTGAAIKYLFYDATHGANIGSPTSYFASLNASTYTRVSFNVTLPAGCTSIRVYPVYIDTNSPGTTFLGDVQTEPGSTATAYWGTDATVGGRDADNLTCTYAMGTGNGTLLALVIPYGWSSTTGAYACDDSTTTGVASAYVNGANHAHGKRKDSVASQDVGGSTLTPTSGTLMQIAVTWDAAHVTCYTNAVAGTPVATTPPYVASSGLQIGAAQGNITPFNGWVGIRAFPTALTQPQLAAINLALSGRI